MIAENVTIAVFCHKNDLEDVHRIGANAAVVSDISDSFDPSTCSSTKNSIKVKKEASKKDDGTNINIHDIS